MGKQIRFFMLGDDEAVFIKLVKEYGDSFLDVRLNRIDTSDLEKEIVEPKKATISPSLSQLFIVSPESNLVKSKNGILDRINSDVIEFSRCSITDENLVWEGRIWAEFKYYDESDELIKKEKWFEQKFNKYRSWIKKNLRISVDKDYYIGEEAYKLYKEKGYRMKAGPKVEIKF